MLVLAACGSSSGDGGGASALPSDSDPSSSGARLGSAPLARSAAAEATRRPLLRRCPFRTQVAP